MFVNGHWPESARDKARTAPSTLGWRKRNRTNVSGAKASPDYVCQFWFCGKSAEGQPLKAVSATKATPYSNLGWLLADVARLALCF
jgi:hypothetical protein